MHQLLFGFCLAFFSARAALVIIDDTNPRITWDPPRIVPTAKCRDSADNPDCDGFWWEESNSFDHNSTVHVSWGPNTSFSFSFTGSSFMIFGDANNRGADCLLEVNGVSSNFSTKVGAGYLNKALSTIDNTTHASTTARNMDSQYHVTDRALGAKNTLTTYFEKALGTPTGQKIRSFYSTGGKSLLDIHNEAKRLADLRKSENRRSAELGATADGNPFVGPEKTTCACGGNEGVCSCEPGKCACAGCDMKGVKKDAKSAQVQFSEAATDIGNTAKDL